MSDPRPFPPVFATNRPGTGETVAAEVNRLLKEPAAWTPLSPDVRCRMARIDLPLGPLPAREEWQAAVAGGGVAGALVDLHLVVTSRKKKLRERVEGNNGAPTAPAGAGAGGGRHGRGERLKACPR